MTIDRWLTEATHLLAAANVGSARLDALVLLEDCMGQDRAYLLAHPELMITTQQQAVLEQQLARREQHEPLAYIRGKTEFYGHEFEVNQHVLEPRPESETMIELLIALLNHKLSATTIIDVGTGSGALAISAKLALPPATVIGIDIDKKCLEVAERNAKMHKVDVVFMQGDLLTPLTTYETLKTANELVLLCNLPYVPNEFQINLAAGHEPRLAIFGGPDGLDLYRKLFAQLKSLPKQPAYILTESLPPQHTELARIAKHHGYHPHTEDDFIQLFSWHGV